MANKKNNFEKLRSNAEEKLFTEWKKQLELNGLENFSELGVYKEELEMQNQELLSIQSKHIKLLDEYSHLFNYAPVGYFILDKNGVVIDVNEMGCEQLSTHKNKIINKPLSIFLNARFQDDFYRFRNLVVESGETKQIECEFIKEGGCGFFALIDCSCTKDEHNNFKHLLITLDDITEKKIADKKTETSEHRFRALIENSADAVAIQSANGEILYVSPSIEKMLGYTEKEFMHMDLNSILHPDDIRPGKEYLEKILASPGVPIRGYKGRKRHKDGSWRWIDATVTNLLNDPAVNGLVTNFRDCTENKIAVNKIQYISGLYEFISQVNKAIVYSDSEQNLYNESCRIAVEFGKYKAAWVSKIDGDRIHLLAQSGINRKDIRFFDNVYFEINGPADIVISTGKYVVSNCVTKESGLERWTKFCTSNQWVSCITLPVKIYGNITALFSLSTSEADSFDAERIALIEEACRDISFTAENFEKDRQRKKAEEKLKAREFRLLQAQSIVHFGSCEVNLSTGNAIWSEGLCTLFGISEEAYIQSYESFFAFIHPDDVDYVKKIAAESDDTMTNIDFFCRIIRKDGALRYLHTRWIYEFNEPGKSVKLFSISQDVTELKQTENNLIAVNRIKTFISGLNRAIVHSNDEQSLLNEACRVAVEYGKYNVAWIGKVDRPNNKLNLAGQYGLSAEDLNLYADYAYEKNGFLGNVISTGNCFFSNDVEFDSHFDKWRPYIDASQSRSLLISPIKKLGNVIATFHLTSTEVNQFNSEVISLIEKACNDISYALDVFEKERLRKEAEFALKKSEENYKKSFQEALRFSEIMDKLPTYIYIKNKNHEYAYANQMVLGMFNRQKEYVFGRDDHEFFPEPALSHIWEIDSQVMEQGLTLRNEVDVFWEGKRIVFFEVKYPLYDEQGQINGLCGISTDITEIKQVQKLLIETEDKLNSRNSRLLYAQEIAQFGSSEFDFSTGIAVWSNELCKIYGLAPEDNVHTKESWYSLIHPQDLEYVKKITRESGTKQSNDGFFHRIIRKDGSIRYLHTRGVPEFNNEGKPTGLFAVSHDITDFKTSEEKLKRSELRLKQAQAIAHLGNWELNISTGSLIWSEETYEIFGLSPENNIHSQAEWLTYIHPDDLELVMNVMKEVEANQCDKSFTNRIIRKDGIVRHIHSIAHFEINKDDNCISLFGTVEDITDLKQIEEKLVKANRLYLFISELKHIIVHSRDKETLFRKACRIAIENGTFAVSWISMLDVANRNANLVAEYGMEPEDIGKFTDIIYDVDGPVDHVIRTGSYYVSNCVENDPFLKNWKPLATMRNWHSYIVLPLKSSGGVVGIFNLCSEQADFFNEENIRLLEEVAYDISFTLDVFEKERQRCKAEEQLAYNNMHLLQSQEIAHYGSCELDLSSGTAIWSKELCNIFGVSPDDNIQSTEVFFSFIHPDDQDYVKKIISESIAQKSNDDFFHRIIRKDGRVRHIQTRGTYESDIYGNCVSVYIVSKDITELKVSEENLVRINRLYAFISDVNHIIVHSNDEQTLLNKICGIATEVGKFAMAWMGFIDEKSNRVTPYVFAGDEHNYLSGIKISTNENEPEGNGPTGVASREGRSVVCNDIGKDPKMIPWKEIALISGYHSSISLPIKKSGKIIYTFTLYASEVNFFDTEEIKLLEDVGLDVSFALDVFENENLRKSAEETLHYRNERLKQAQEIANYGGYEIDYATGINIWSEQLCKIYGLPVEENILSHGAFLSFVFGEDRERVKNILSNADATLSNVSFYHRIVRTDGEFRHLHTLRHIEYNPEGKPIGAYAVVHDITDLKEKEIELLESEQRFKSVLQSAQDTVVLFNDEGNIIFWNNSAEKTFGYTEKEISGQSLSVLMPEGYRKDHSDIFRKHVLTSQSNIIGKVLEVNGQRKDGTLFPLEISVSYWESDKGKYYCAIIRDISDRKRTEQLQLLSNAVLTTLNSNLELREIMRDVIKIIYNELDLSAVGIPLKYGEDFPYYEQIGFTNSFLKKENTLIARDKDGNVCRDKDGNAILECTCGLVLSGNIQNTESILTKAGSFVTNNSYPLLELSEDQDQRLHPRNTCIHFGYGSIMISPIKVHGSIVGTLQINQKKQNAFTSDTISFLEDLCLSIGNTIMRLNAKEALRNSEKFLHETQDIAHLGTYAMDMVAGKWTSSAILDNIFGIGPDYDRTVENWLNIVHPDHRKMMSDYFIAEVLGNKNRFDKEYKIVRINDKEERWVHGLGGLKFNDKNEVILMVGTITDITESKQAEQERNKMLADIVLRNKDLEQFSYIVSHNLRAPVANIIGISDLLQMEEPDNKEENNMVKMLSSSVNKLDTVIKDLNSVLQVKHQVNENRELIKFSELLADINISIDNLLRNEDVKIISDFSAVDGMFTIKSYLYSIFFNLISNSIKYRQPNIAPIIEITSIKGNNRVELIFKDNGLGIDLKNKGDQVFGLYKRFHDHTEGKGMGLFMVKTQVETLGGKITIESEVNKGTTFTIVFENILSTFLN